MAGGEARVLIVLVRTFNGKYTVATVNNDRMARELEQAGYARIYEEVDGDDQGDGQ